MSIDTKLGFLHGGEEGLPQDLKDKTRADFMQSLKDKLKAGKKLKGSESRKLKAYEKAKYRAWKNKGKEAKLKNKAQNLAEKLRAEKLRAEKLRAEKLRAEGKFIHAGLALFKPENGLEVFNAASNIIGDKSIGGNLKLEGAEVEANAANGDFLLVLKRVDTKDFKYAAITVAATEILKAREQRLQLAYTGGLEIVASLIVRGLSGKVDKRLKDPKKIIDRYKEDFLATYSLEEIVRDIERMIINL